MQILENNSQQAAIEEVKIAMKKSIFVISALIIVVYLAGCGKKEPALEESQEPLSMEAMSALNSQTQHLAETDKTANVAVESKAKAHPVTQPKLKPLPPPGPYSPTVRKIQTALKNAGFYRGIVDGKKGPLTKEAIRAFQKANGLDVDGKVGPKTWGALSSYLKPEPAVQTKKR